MKKDGILGKAVRLLTGLKYGCLENGEELAKLGETDSAVLRVAMMISAIDGDVSDDEFAAFETLAKRCRGYSAESAAAVLKAGLRSAGYLQLQARRLKEKELVAEFSSEAMAALSRMFACGDVRDLRRAFVMWTVMAMADGDYSGVERACLDELRKRMADVIKRVRAAGLSGAVGYATAMMGAGPATDALCLFPEVPNEAFLARAEGLVARLRNEADSAEATAALKALIVEGR